jgi:hypothetical protein
MTQAIIKDIRAENLMQLTFELFRRLRDRAKHAAATDVSL